MTLKNNRAPLLCYFKLCASFHSHWCIQTWVTVRKRPIWVKIRRFLELCDLEIWRMTLKNNRAPAQCCLKPCASFRSHWWNQTGVTVRKRPIWVKFDDFLELCDLEIWRMTLKKNRAPLLSNIKLCASFHHDIWIQTGVTVRKRLSWLLTSVTLTFDLWPWPFAWTSLLSLVTTPENFMMMWWWEHSQKGVTDGQTDEQTDRRTDRRTDWTIHRAAWSQLKMFLCQFYNWTNNISCVGQQVISCRGCS